ncbi:hypothetical protein GHT06_018566 [Daphnia sinensis]|uniref:Uncharacterized protein n=1 Tax=Daphnia sinensis TaxID=1820382 RepID=A0AAD5PQA0_9CRUS|nr:hypothetical protein GHT06_018566 [Daphnia sinensis]
MQLDCVSDFFSVPATKLFCRQLKDCRNSRSTDFSRGENQCERWIVPLRSFITGREINYCVHTVWLQGNILHVINDSHVILKDVSGGIVKISLVSFPVTDWIQQGVYCSVIGTVVSSSQTPLIQAIKMTKLDNSLNLQILWEWEVKDLADQLCNDA